MVQEGGCVASDCISKKIFGTIGDFSRSLRRCQARRTFRLTWRPLRNKPRPVALYANPRASDTSALTGSALRAINGLLLPAVLLEAQKSWILKH